MEQELISNKRIAIIGAGPAGCICAKFLKDFGLEVFIFEKDKPLKTLLPTGGGKCNLAHAEFDFKQLAKNYPRGEKFLYSVFSRFCTGDTIEFFDSIGVESYIREDNRIFPVSNSSKDVREKFLKSLKGVNFIRGKCISIMSNGNSYVIKTDKSTYLFDIVVVASGGVKENSFKNLEINIVEPTQSLVGLVTEKNFVQLAGVSLRGVMCDGLKGDILFTHKGISGPLIYTLSSIYARRKFPYDLSLKLVEDIDLQTLLNENSNKEIKNLIGQIVPKSFANFLLEDIGLAAETPCHKINGAIRNKISEALSNFVITVTGKSPEGEIVTCGGVDLDEINSKTMESKKYKNLYFCGEVIDVDGFCGGFNLQNCWSTGFVAANGIIQSLTI